MSSMNLLLVDDDEVLLRALKRSLTALGYGIATCSDGDRVLEAIASTPGSIGSTGSIGSAGGTANLPVSIDMVILDVMLPGKDGFTVLREIRERYPELPVIMLTARSEDIDKVLGLEMGADDYLAKPFNVRELAARVKAVSRRTSAALGPAVGGQGGSGGLGGSGGPGGLRGSASRTSVKHGDFLLDLQGRRVWKAGREISLTAREFDVLALMFGNRGMVFTREKLLEQCWGYDYLGDSRAVDVLVSRLREKIEDDPESPRVIRTRRGVGYYSE